MSKMVLSEEARLSPLSDLTYLDFIGSGNRCHLPWHYFFLPGHSWALIKGLKHSPACWVRESNSSPERPTVFHSPDLAGSQCCMLQYGHPKQRLWTWHRSSSQCRIVRLSISSCLLRRLLSGWIHFVSSDFLPGSLVVVCSYSLPWYAFQEPWVFPSPPQTLLDVGDSSASCACSHDSGLWPSDHSFFSFVNQFYAVIMICIT